MASDSFECIFNHTPRAIVYTQVLKQHYKSIELASVNLILVILTLPELFQYVLLEPATNDVVVVHQLQQDNCWSATMLYVCFGVSIYAEFTLVISIVEEYRYSSIKHGIPSISSAMSVSIFVK